MVVLGVSRDDITANAAFANAYGLPFRLLCDIDGHLCVNYEACSDTEDEPRRIAYIINESGNIEQVFANVSSPALASVIFTSLRGGADIESGSQEVSSLGLYKELLGR